MVGHNVYGGPCDFKKSVKFLIQLVEKLIEMELPTWERWEVRRVDVSEVFILPSFESVVEWFRGINNASYPRREVDRFGLHGLYAKASTTAVKFYHKGVEFSKHDRKRLKRYMDKQKINELQEKANVIIRTEVEIKPRKLIYDFGNTPLVGQVSDEYLNRVYDVEVKRILNEGVRGYKLVRSAQDVKQRLYSVYSNQLAGNLMGTWYALSTLGDSALRGTIPDSTLRRHKKQLKDIGIEWKGTNVILRENQFNLVPQDFAPVRNDIRRSVEVCPEVYKKLKAIA